MTHELISDRARLRGILDAIESPCWVVHPNGRAMLRNVAASAEVPVWVGPYVRSEILEPPPGARIRTISVDGHERLLVLDASPPSPALEGLVHGLDELHAETVEHLIRGLSDVEIALVLGLALPETHRLIVRLHRMLGVRTRAELVERFLGGRGPSVPPNATQAVPRVEGPISERVTLSARRTRIA